MQLDSSHDTPPRFLFLMFCLLFFYLFILFIYIYTYFFPHLLFPLPSEGIHSVIFPFLQLFLFLISYNPKLDCTQKGSHTCSVLYSNYNTIPKSLIDTHILNIYILRKHIANNQIYIA